VSEAVAEVPSVVQSVGENLGFVSSALNPSLANALSGEQRSPANVCLNVFLNLSFFLLF
jgi:hypothetical protein